MGGEERLFATDPWGQEFMVLQSGKAGDFPLSMGMSEVQLPVHAGELLRPQCCFFGAWDLMGMHAYAHCC